MDTEKVQRDEARPVRTSRYIARVLIDVIECGCQAAATSGNEEVIALWGALRNEYLPRLEELGR